MFGSHVSIQLYIAREHDLQDQITDNSMDLRLTQIHSSANIASIHDDYNREESMIRNEIRSLDDKGGFEYNDLMAELQELMDEEDRAVEEIERQNQDYESGITIENASLETQLQAVQADKEGFQESRKEDIEKNFNYGGQ